MRGMAFTPTWGMGFTAGMTLVRVEGATGSPAARRSAWITSRATRTGSSRATSALQGLRRLCLTDLGTDELADGLLICRI